MFANVFFWKNVHILIEIELDSLYLKAKMHREQSFANRERGKETLSKYQRSLF